MRLHGRVGLIQALDRRETFLASLKPQQTEAAQEFVTAAMDALSASNNRLHAETVIAATARMAGTFLFRSFAFPLDGVEPGQSVFSDAANEQGPALIQILGNALQHSGVNLDRSQPAESHDDKPLLNFLATQKLLEPTFATIRGRLGLSYQEAAESAAVASAILIQRCASVLDPHSAFNIAAYGFVEGSKTAPDPVAAV